jgi:predicted HD phosphohydrolase
VRSFELQGGKLAGDAVEAFRNKPFAADTGRVRKWDDRAKTPGATTKRIGDYAELLRSLAL